MFFKFMRRFGWLSAGLGLTLALAPFGTANAASTMTNHVILADGGNGGSSGGQGNGGHNHGKGSGGKDNGTGSSKKDGGGTSTSPTPATTPETPYAALFPISVVGGALWVYKRRRSSVPN